MMSPTRERWAEHFGARAWIHDDDADAAPWASHRLHGPGDTEIRPGLTVVPLPGHTKGSVAYLLDETFLFSGDSLAWERAYGRWRRPGSRRHAVLGTRGLRRRRRSSRLAGAHQFSWVLPGHGGRRQGDAGEMHRRLVALVERMGG